MSEQCPWCLNPFRPARGKVYCSKNCRMAVHTALHDWAQDCLKAGTVTHEFLWARKKGPRTAYTPRRQAEAS